MSCSIHVTAHSPLDLVQAVGQLLLPVGAAWTIVAISRRYPTHTARWSSRWLKSLGRPGVIAAALVVLAIGLLAFGTSVLTSGCGGGMGVLGATGLLLTLSGAMAAAVAWAVITHAGWVVLATFFALDLWIIFGMTMMHLRDVPDAPDSILVLAFAMHAVCMYLTTVWGFHARNLSMMAQIRAGEAGRSIGAVWVFLAAYIVVSFFHNEMGPFDSANGGAVLSALTLSALALTMGGGYTKYREVMAEQTTPAGDQSPPTAISAGRAGKPAPAER